MLLAIDIGNTNIVLGIFDKSKLKVSWRLATDTHRLSDEYGAILLNLLPQEGLATEVVDKAILCSVVPPLESTFVQLCQRYFRLAPLIVGAGVKTGVRICTDNPREVGADRVVNAAAAHRLYRGPLIVIDLGTATTFDAVSAEGDYLGGAIAPGIGIAAEALALRTAKLPQIELVLPEQAIGKNTITAMQSGVMFGYIGLIEGIVARMKHELGGKVKTIATGGFSPTMAKQTKAIDIVNPDLTLVGLRLIYEMNHPQEGT